MPLIEVTQSRYVSATIRLDSATANLVDQYAAFVHGSADDVVDKALNYVFAKDREFQEYLKSSQSDGAEPTANGKATVVGVETRREQVPKAASVPEESRSVLRTG
jgi:uncharacterized protein (DUF2342 family)